jgi:uncharacterized protein (DUF1501 family)
VTYGLGSLNQDLPGFIVLPEVSYPQGGSANWGNGHLPASYQGTALRPKGSPILDLQPPKGITLEHQRANLDVLATLNAQHAAEHPWHEDLKARMENYELAFRMQMQVPGVIDLEKEDAKTKEAYGIGQDATDAFGRKCLLARKLVEQGVRFVQLYAGTWDSHDYIERAHGNLIRSVDQPIAALLKDLKQRGLLEDTLVVWTTEFGRTPFNNTADAKGREHHPWAFSSWLAGAGVKPGIVYGETDEHGVRVAKDGVHVHDLHATILRLMGFDHEKLTYRHSGRDYRLTDVAGKVIQGLLA